MSEKITSTAPLVEYTGVQILYLEDSNKWRFELRGRERKADSLKQAKEWIDKPAPVKKASKSFERFECYQMDRFYGYGDQQLKVEVVTVTSVAQDTYRGTNCVAWITNKNGERSKANVDVLFEISEETKKKIAEFNATIKMMTALKEQNAKVLKSVKRVNLEKYVDNGDE